MAILFVLISAFLLSADSFLFGLTLGIKKIRLTAFSLLFITLTGLIILMAANFISTLISQNLEYGSYIGSFILIGTGIWLCSDTENSTKNILSNPECSDFNNSKKIEFIEALIIGMVLSIDSSAVVIGWSENSLILTVFILIFQSLLLILGSILGKKCNKAFTGNTISIITGFIIVLIGLYRLTSLFY